MHDAILDAAIPHQIVMEKKSILACYTMQKRAINKLQS